MQEFLEFGIIATLSTSQCVLDNVLVVYIDPDVHIYCMYIFVRSLKANAVVCRNWGSHLLTEWSCAELYSSWMFSVCPICMSYYLLRWSLFIWHWHTFVFLSGYMTIRDIDTDNSLNQPLILLHMLIVTGRLCMHSNWTESIYIALISSRRATIHITWHRDERALISQDRLSSVAERKYSQGLTSL